MSGKRNLRLPRREKVVKEIVGQPAALSFCPLTLDRWDDLTALFGPRGACAGCWCMWWRLTSREFREGAGGTNQDRFRECVREPIPPGVLAYRDHTAVGWCAVAPNIIVSPPHGICNQSMIRRSGPLRAFTWPETIVVKASPDS
jgi:hypothetical protein